MRMMGLLWPRLLLRILVASLVSIGSIANAAECYQSSITAPSPFMGNNDEVFVLADGSIWQVKYEYEYLYEYAPSVVICPSRGVLIVKGKSLSVVPLRSSRVGDSTRATRSPTNAITVVYRIDGCDYFAADGPAGFYVLEWYRGYDPSVGDKLVGYERGYGFKNVTYLHNGREGRIYAEDYLLSAESAASLLAEKCR